MPERLPAPPDLVVAHQVQVHPPVRQRLARAPSPAPSTRRSEIPGGSASAFCDAEITTSAPHRSMRTGIPPTLDTASTSSSVSGIARVTAASDAMSVDRAGGGLDVDRRHRVVAAVLERQRRAAPPSPPPPAAPSPASPRGRSARRSARIARRTRRSRARARAAASPQRTAASIIPVAAQVATYTGRVGAEAAAAAADAPAEQFPHRRARGAPPSAAPSPRAARAAPRSAPDRRTARLHHSAAHHVLGRHHAHLLPAATPPRAPPCARDGSRASRRAPDGSAGPPAR